VHRLANPPRIVKVVVGGSVAAHPSFRLSHGSHEVVLGFDGVRHLPDANLALAHFPVRSVAQFAAKIAVAQLTIRLVPERSADTGIHYEHLRSRVPISLSMTPAELRRAAACYSAPSDMVDAALVRDPVVTRDRPLRYSDGKPADPLARVERVARELADPRAAMPGDTGIGRFVEAKLAAENQLMRNALQSIIPEWNRHDLADLERIVAQLRSSDAQLQASRIWRALAPYRRLRSWMKARPGAPGPRVS
jgi:hypothetical protein